ncbi:hypothetical protein BDQ17DRAFT_1453821 [Cyathus striatus]|nr:hypothetical protein BDQ17DRAFT_1453821 [Cyathus striatus]
MPPKYEEGMDKCWEIFGSPGGSEEGIKIVPNKTIDMSTPITVPPPLLAKFTDPVSSPPLKPKHSTNLLILYRYTKIRHVELDRLSKSKLISLLLRSESKEHYARSLLHSAIYQLARLGGKYHTAVDHAYGLEERARGTEWELEGVKRERERVGREEWEEWEKIRVRRTNYHDEHYIYTQ